jgi:hypothetical protein
MEHLGQALTGEALDAARYQNRTPPQLFWSHAAHPRPVAFADSAQNAPVQALCSASSESGMEAAWGRPKLWLPPRRADARATLRTWIMSRFRTLLACAALLALTLAAYLPLWRNEFIDFDDGPYIAGNPRITAGLSWDGFCWTWTNHDAPYPMPVTWLSLQFDAQCFSSRDSQGHVILSPAAFHADNLLWHGASVVLLFGLWQRMTGSRRYGFLVAALFAVHPMHVESVAWAIERKDVLSGFFGLLTLWAYVRYLERPGLGRYLPMVLAFVLSLLSKPTLITLPLVLLLLDYWPLRRLQPAQRTAQTANGPTLAPVPMALLVREKIPLFGLAIGMALLTLVTRTEHGSLVSVSDIPLSARLANAGTGYGWYLYRSFCPTHLAVLYPHPREHWSALSAIAGAGVLLGITSLVAWQRSRRPWLLTGWLWFVVTLLPVIGLAQGGAQAWADRFSYWPHIGLFAAVLWTVREVVHRLRIPAWAAAVPAAGLLACGSALTWVQVGYWRDSLTLWEHALTVTGDNERAQIHVSLYYRRQGRLAEAESHLAEAFRLQSQGLRGARHAPPEGLPAIEASSPAGVPGASGP